MFCDDALGCVETLQAADVRIAVMDGHAEKSLFDERDRANTVFVLGGETDGASSAIKNAANVSLRIPMQNGVESLNVAVTAALISFLG